MKILNLFAGIGGNRTLWGDEHEITAIEFNQRRAMEYLKLFPKDNIIIGDAYQYFISNFEYFNIIWASPPCTSHTIITYMNIGHRYKGKNNKCHLPDMKLYGLILFLQHHFRGNWIVENVIPYYKPLIRPTCIRGRHCYWSNISIPSRNKKSMKVEIGNLGKDNWDTERKQDFRNKIDKNEGLILLNYLLEKTQMKIL